MKKFLIRSFFFAALLAGYFGANNTINRLLIEEYTIKNEKISVLIAGDSHARNSFDPQYFHSAKNISQLAEPYFFTFWKLQTILKRNSVDTVILGFCHHNITFFNDVKMAEKNWTSEMFGRIYPIEHFEDLTNVEIDYQTFYKTYVQNMCLYPQKNHGDWIGEYGNTDQNVLADSLDAIKRHYFREDSLAGFSETCISYIDSIVALCQKQNVELILVGTPVHQGYFNNIPQPNIDRYNAEKNRLIKKGVTVYDFTNAFYQDELYLNSDHLNNSGAKKFTLEMMERIKL